MTNTDTAPTTAESKRARVSKRGFIDGNGAEVERIEEAAGASYELLGEGGQAFNFQCGEPGKAETMLAIFGFHTKVGNVANTVLNDKNDPGSPADAAAAIAEFIGMLGEGKWAERAAGGGAAQKIDKDALAAAYVAWAETKGATKDVVETRQKLDDNPALVRTLRQNPEIAKLYMERTGKTGKTADELLDML